MKYLVGISFALAIALGAGCAPHKAVQKTTTMPVHAATPSIITPDYSLTATVLMFNPAIRIVVLNFPSGNLPRHDQVLFIYHGGLKAGEVKITGPEHDNNVVADLTGGTAQAGDEVRDQ